MGVKDKRNREKNKYVFLGQVYAVKLNKGEQLFWDIHYCG